MSNSPSRKLRLKALRAEVRAIETAGRGSVSESLPFGIEALDSRLRGGGLPLAALHEMAGMRPDLSDEAAATSFAGGIAARCGEGAVLWALARRDLFAPGLAQAGLPPGRLIFAECRRDEDVLAVMEEGLRHGGLAAVVGEIGRASMASTRRLQLAAEEGSTAALILKKWRKGGTDPLAAPSAATTRWRIACVASGELPVEGVGRPRWNVELARQRGGGGPFSWILEGTDAEGRLALPAEPCHRPDSADRWSEGRRAA
ncbi:MAG TPA: protein ImuA [Allosphingosinicella sp.]|nr:protein ImuA [Allosphingosinicella sp.]